MLKKTITLTNDQIKALPTVPIEIVAAPGSGKMIVPFRALLSVNASAGAYTNLDVWSQTNSFQGTIYFALDAANNFIDALGITIAQFFLNATTIKVALCDALVGGLAQIALNNNVTADGYAISSTVAHDLGVENTNLSIVGQNTGNFTGGNAANTMKVTVWYDIVDI